jgi:sugar lactone lactonase YvrE
LSFDSSNNLFIADHVNNRVRRVDYNSKNITTVAGNGATGADGDEGAATSANLGYPCGVIVDSSSSYLYISQVYDHKIRRVSLSTYIISTLAGTGSAIFSGDDGLAILAGINQPHQMTFDRDGDMYVTDTGSNRIRKIAATTSIISTVVGTGDKGYSGDGGAATSAMLTQTLLTKTYFLP